jgi:hypothetical protein
MCNDVQYLQIFCNLCDIMHDVPAAAKVIIQIRGFHQLEKKQAKTGLDKLLTPTLSVFLAGQWARCESGLCRNEAYEN